MGGPGSAGLVLPRTDFLLALIGATALLTSIPLYTCNPRHYPMPELDLRAISAGS
jgi:predicted nucleic acid-binding protein